MNLLNKYKDDNKQTWKILNAIRKGKKFEHSSLSYFVVSNEYTINEQKVTANKFNNLINSDVGIGSDICC